MRPRVLPQIFSALFALGLTGLLAGCSTGFQPDPHQRDRSSIGSIQGVEHGGQSPISGAQIYLYAAGTGGYGGAAASLLQAGGNTLTDGAGKHYVLTDADGNFNLTGDYTCTAGTQVYAVAVGGNPGLSAGTNNTAIVQMAGLGQCPASGNLAAQVPYLVINEVSTVAFAYSMGGFATNAYNVSSSGTALAQTGIANAMLNTSNIVNIQYGQAPAQANANPNSVVPQSKIYTLANILAACVNTSSPSSSQCAALFAAATSTGTSGGTKATNEAEAIFNIVHHPTANTAALFTLQTTNSPFVGLASAPADWTLPIVYTNVVSRPGNIAFDSLGDAWISDRDGHAVVRMSPQGAATTITQSGVGIIYNVAVDPSDVVWAADYTNSQIYRLDTSGAVLSATNTGSLANPTSIAFNSSGNAFVVNAGSTAISRFTAAGVAQTAAAYHAGLGTPQWISVDASGNAWIPTYGASCQCVGELASGGATASTIADKLLGIIGSGQLADSSAFAVDSAGNTWQANVNNKLIEFSTQLLLGVGIYVNDNAIATNGGLNAPATLAIDGGGNLWVANSGTDTVSGFSVTGSTLTPLYSTTSGFPTGSATSAKAYAAAPDASGNLWTANSDGTVTQILGLATPTATPVVPGQFGAKP